MRKYCCQEFKQMHEYLIVMIEPTNGKWYLSDSSGPDTKINFCPICGKNLYD